MFDHEEERYRSEEVLALVDSLRPQPGARLTSRRKMAVIAALSGDEDLIGIVRRADERTLFWEVDGEYVSTRIEKVELPV